MSKASEKRAALERKRRIQKTVLLSLLALAAVLLALILFFLLRPEPRALTSLPEDYESGSYAVIEIEDYGVIIARLCPSEAPLTVSQFKRLANEGFYDGLTFHRILEGFMMQGGDPAFLGREDAPTIPGEFSSNGWDNGLIHSRGVLSMARTNDPNSATSQFFIVHETSPHLDGDYAAFGYVVDGMDAVDQICEDARPYDGNGNLSLPRQPVIKYLYILEK